MNRDRLFLAAVVALAAAALAWRLPGLDARPMHGDEARDAYTLGRLLETGTYTYDPAEFHGPSLYYLAAPVALVQGKHTFASLTERDVRLVPVLAGVGLVLLLPLVADALGRGAALAAGTAGVFCPAMVYYDRYYIHESLLVLFTFAAVAAGWRYTRTRKVGWAVTFGASVGMMHATKETCVLALACMGAAAGVEALAARRGRVAPATDVGSSPRL